MTAYSAAFTDKDGNVIYPHTKAESILDADEYFVDSSKFAITDQRSKTTEDNLNSLTSTYNREIPDSQGNIKKLQDFQQQNQSDNSAWSDWTTNGMTLLNGAQIYGGDYDYPRYRTRKVNGTAQAQIGFRIKNLTQGGDMGYVGFPLNIQPDSSTQIGLSTPTSLGRTASWTIDNGLIQLHGNSDNNFNSDYWYPFFIQWEVKK